MRNNKVLLIAAMVVVAVVPVTLMTVMAPAQAAVDVVHGVRPVSDQFTTHAVSIQTALKNLPVAEHAAFIHVNYPNLDEDAVLYLERRGKLRPSDTVSRVEFRFGSLEGVLAETGETNPDGTPKAAHGFFNEQLVALVFVEGREEPLAVIMECGNGLINRLPEDDRFQVAGVAEPRVEFTIASGESLNDHTSHETALNFAEACGLTVTRGRGKDLEVISVATARGLDTDEVFVRVIVYAGDRFSLRGMTCTPARNRT